MAGVKITGVQLTIFLACLIWVIHLMFPPGSSGSKHDAIQFAAFRTPADLTPEPAGDQSTTVKDSVAPEQKKPEPEPAALAHAPVSKPKKKSNYLVLRIFGDENVIELKKDLIVYGNNHFPLFLRKFYIRVVEKTYLYPVIILFILLILIFILNILIVILLLYYTNQQKNRNERQFRIYSNMYEMALRSYVFGEINWERALVKLKRIKKPANRKILTTVLFNFQDNLRGEMDYLIPEIFVKLGLHTDAREKAKSSSYYHQVMGIRELTNLYPEGAKALVRMHINDPNDLVRAEAQVSYIRLNPDKPFDFFRTLTTPFTRWTQLSAFYLFRLHQLPVPAFVDYLDSDHPNVRNFSLWMIIYFQQIEHASEIYRMLESPMELTRFLAVKAINDLRLFDGKELIKTIYPEETGKTRLEIIKTIRTIGNSDDFDFLESIIRTGTVSEKTEACRSMYFVNNEGRDRLLCLKQQPDPDLGPYIAHVTEPRN